MAEAKQAAEPSMEEILASIRRIISDEDSQNAAGDGQDSDPAAAGPESKNQVEPQAADDMGDSTEMSQDDLDKLFDMDEPADDGVDDDADDMAAAMAEDALQDMAGEDAEEDVLELTEDLELSEDDVDLDLVDAMPDTPDEAGDIAFVDGVVEDDVLAVDPQPEPARPVPAGDLPNVAKDAPLTSSDTGEAVHASLDTLSSMFIGGNAQTVEELIQDMLRPMLKSWLDENLPGMVEQMVQKEIQRITRRR
ncbi:MAG: DUF2497 domain-containing protein [Roseibium sp.]|nr:DUF2497 domain-containing protein [Roseibium sp.]